MKGKFILTAFITLLIFRLLLNSHVLAATPPPPETLEDLGFANFKKGPYLKSDWLESQKALYRDLLKNSTYDILVVPFQVQGYAIDRVGRSLMTRYLSYKIEKSTELRVPDPTLVARALGERLRTFDNQEVYRMADELKVKTLIKGYVGHNCDEKMKLTLFIQTRDKNGNLNSQTEVIKLDWQDIPFSDERPPSDVFLSIMGDIINKLPLLKTKTPELHYYAKADNLSLPETILAMVKNKPASPILGAYNLQLLGVLYPEDTTYSYPDDTMEREHFFERSLVALSMVSPKSADYPLLKARALFYLHRRPAALAVIGSPSHPEGKALMAVLNGNLPELEKWVSQIKSPLHKLIAEVELRDLRWSYGHKPPTEEIIKTIVGSSVDWEMIISRRLQAKDPWYLQSNLVVKQKLDEAFSIPDFTAANLFKSKMVLSDLNEEADDIDFSVYNHYKRLLTNVGQKFLSNGSAHPLERDYLDLLYGIGESNLIKNVRYLMFTQGLYEQSLKTINRYEMLYRGNIRLTNQKVIALRFIARQKQEQIRENINKEIKENENNVCFWSQGQTRIAHDCYGSNVWYLLDYPRRYYWSNLSPTVPLVKDTPKKNKLIETDISSLAEDTKTELYNLSLSLLYSNDFFYSLETLYEKILQIKMPNEAEKLLEANKNRFVGNPKQTNFIADKMSKKGDMDDVKKTYENAITATPELWETYNKLAGIYIKEGNFKKAFETYMRYPAIKNADDNDTVALANNAQAAANEFHKRGAINEAIPFFKLSANLQTGSSSSMWSAAVLGLLNQDYVEAADHFLENARRYNLSYSYMYYISLLHLMGYRQEAWSIFNTLNIDHHSRSSWITALVGFRMDGKTNEEISQWMSKENTNKISLDEAGRYILLTYMIDRRPDEQMHNKLAEINSESSKKVANIFHMALFSRGYYFFRTKKFTSAYDTFNQFEKEFLKEINKYTYRIYSYVIPYYAWSCIKSDRVSSLRSLLESIRTNISEDFYFHLSMAFIEGNKRNHSEAIKHLKSSLYNIPHTLDSTIFPWYQLVEACEWLYEDTGDTEYRKLALQWAKTYQLVHPMFAWAYAVEAKYTDSDTDRIRSLAITLYLDKQSERISKFSEKEKAEALEWLKKNNPFLSNTSKPLKTTL